MSRTKKNNGTIDIKAFIKKNGAQIETLKYEVSDGEISVKVRPTIPFTERCLMVNEIYNGVFMGNNSTIDEFSPEYLWLLKRYCAIKHFTDFPLSDNLDEAWVVLSATSLYKDVAALIQGELDCIFEEADRKIEARKTYLANKTDINALISKFGDSVGNMGEELSKVDPKLLTNFLKNIANIAPEDVVKSVLKVQNEKEANDNKKIN